MLRFKRIKTLQQLASTHAAFHNHFNQERHLVSRDLYRERRSAALAEWQTLAAKATLHLPSPRNVKTSWGWTDGTTIHFAGDAA